MSELKVLTSKIDSGWLGEVEINNTEAWVKFYQYEPTTQEVLKDFNIRLRSIRRNLK